MGQSASAARATAKDNEKEANDALNSLETMAQLKFEAFSQKIHNSSDSVVIPVDKILVSDHVVHISASMDSSVVGKAVKDVAGKFASGKILDGATWSFHPLHIPIRSLQSRFVHRYH